MQLPKKPLQFGNSRGNRLTVDGNVKVHSLTTQFSSLQAVKPNDSVGFRTERRYNGQRVVTELWILPAGSVAAP